MKDGISVSERQHTCRNSFAGSAGFGFLLPTPAMEMCFSKAAFQRRDRVRCQVPETLASQDAMYERPGSPQSPDRPPRVPKCYRIVGCNGSGVPGGCMLDEDLLHEPLGRAGREAGQGGIYTTAWDLPRP